MKEILPDIDKLFRDAVDQHEAHPSPRVWDNIEQSLDKKTVIRITKRYDQLKKIAVILLLLLGGVTGYLLLKPSSTTNLAKESKAVTNPLPSLSPSKKEAINKEAQENNAINKAPENEINKLPQGTSSKLNKTAETEANTTSASQSGGRSNLYGAGYELLNGRKKGATQIKIINPNISQPGKENSIENTFTSNNKSSNNISNNLLSFNTDIVRLPLGIIEFNSEKLLSNSTEKPRMDQSPTAGNTTAVNPKKSKTSVGKRLSIAGFYSPDLSFNTLRDDRPHGPGMDRDHIKHNESHAFSYTSGISMGYDINKHFSVQAGLGYSQSTIDNHPKDILAEKDDQGDVKFRFDASCGYGYLLPKSAPPPHVGDTLRGVSSNNLLQYVQVPVSAKYSIQKGRISLNALAGVSFNTLISGKLNTTINNASIKETQTIDAVEGLKKHSISGLIGGGVDYHLNNKISVNFSPTVRLALSSINSGSVVKSYPTTLGLSSGIRLHF